MIYVVIYAEQSVIQLRAAFAVQIDASPFHAKTRQTLKVKGAACGKRIIGSISGENPYINSKCTTGSLCYGEVVKLADAPGYNIVWQKRGISQLRFKTSKNFIIIDFNCTFSSFAV